MFDNMFNGVMGKIKNGCCRLSMNGRIAVKTSNGYKTYNPDTGTLTDCSNFVLDIADDFFMLMPTRTLKPGDIVLINGRPVYVLENKGKNRIEVMCYEDSAIQTVIPERHAIMGRKFYGKIVSLVGNGFGKGKGGFFKNMLKFKMMSSMFGGANSSDNMFGGNSMAMMMLMGNGGMDGLFSGICDEEDDDGEDGNIFQNLMNDDDDCEDVPVEIGEEFETPDKKTYVKTGKKTAKKASKKAIKR